MKIMKNICVDLTDVLKKSQGNPYPFALGFYPNDTNTFLVCSDQGIVKSNRFNHKDEYYPKEYRQHMLDYADGSVTLEFAAATRVEASVYDWHIADLYNGRMAGGASTDNPAEFIMGQMYQSRAGEGGPGVGPSGHGREIGSCTQAGVRGVDYFHESG